MLKVWVELFILQHTNIVVMFMVYLLSHGKSWNLKFAFQTWKSHGN